MYFKNVQLCFILQKVYGHLFWILNVIDGFTDKELEEDDPQLESLHHVPAWIVNPNPLVTSTTRKPHIDDGSDEIIDARYEQRRRTYYLG